MNRGTLCRAAVSSFWPDSVHLLPGGDGGDDPPLPRAPAIPRSSCSSLLRPDASLHPPFQSDCSLDFSSGFRFMKSSPYFHMERRRVPPTSWENFQQSFCPFFFSCGGYTLTPHLHKDFEEVFRSCVTTLERCAFRLPPWPRDSPHRTQNALPENHTPNPTARRWQKRNNRRDMFPFSPFFPSDASRGSFPLIKGSKLNSVSEEQRARPLGGGRGQNPPFIPCPLFSLAILRAARVQIEIRIN